MVSRSGVFGGPCRTTRPQQPSPPAGPPPSSAAVYTLAWGRGRTCPEPAEGFGRLRPKSVRGLPVEAPAPASLCRLNRRRAGRVFPSPFGRGRACPGLDPGVRRPRRKPVRVFHPTRQLTPATPSSSKSQARRPHSLLTSPHSLVAHLVPALTLPQSHHRSRRLNPNLPGPAHRLRHVIRRL